MTRNDVKPGLRFRLARMVERFPHFNAEPGNTGTVLEVVGTDHLVAKMDKAFPGGEDWDNEIQWMYGVVTKEGKELDAIDDFLSDVEAI